MSANFYISTNFFGNHNIICKSYFTAENKIKFYLRKKFSDKPSDNSSDEPINEPEGEPTHPADNLTNEPFDEPLGEPKEGFASKNKKIKIKCGVVNKKLLFLTFK